jgi:hypothetical protein
MYDAEKATIDALRLQFERQLASRDLEVRTTAAKYVTALSVLIDAFNDGPGADSRKMSHDTTGTLNRIEADVVWAEAERHRVRAELTTVV